MFRAYWSRYPRVLARLYGRFRMGPVNQKKVKRLAIASQQRTNPDDYVSRFVPGESERFDYGIDFVECAIIKFLRAEGAEELAPVLCELDWPLTELIGIELMRTTTLAQGGEPKPIAVATQPPPPPKTVVVERQVPPCPNGTWVDGERDDQRNALVT